MTNDAPTGKRFSHLYLGLGEPLKDSKRMRERLAVAAPMIVGLSKHLHAELGIPVRQKDARSGRPYGVHATFFRESSLRDILDAITLIFQHCKRLSDNAALSWLTDTRRIFSEENVGYSIDDQAGVHYAVDSAFEAARAGVIAALRAPRYANALSMFEQGLNAMDAVPPDGKSAIRATFAAAEGLFRVMYPTAARLGAAEAERHLGREIATLYSADSVARRAGAKFIGSFKNWIDGAHFYRHEPGQEDVTQPPIEIAVLVIQEGAGFIRWMAQVDGKRPFV